MRAATNICQALAASKKHAHHCLAFLSAKEIPEGLTDRSPGYHPGTKDTKCIHPGGVADKTLQHTSGLPSSQIAFRGCYPRLRSSNPSGIHYTAISPNACCH